MLISLIVATYNAESTLRNCLDSIVPQLNEDCELIVVDGGSIDETRKIIHSYQQYISYSVSEPDRGIYDAWNKGIKIAKGQWIAFVGADDTLLADAVETYLNVIKATPNIEAYDYICAKNEHVDMKGSLLKVIGEEPKWSIMRKRMAPAHVGSLHNRHNLFGMVGNYDFESFHICADYELLMRKRDGLKYLMLSNHIARMKVGGMSFSTKAIVETFMIRKKHHSVPYLYNYLLFIRDWVLFAFFIIRKRMMGANF